MKKLLFALLAISSFASLNAQTVLFEDDFESYTAETNTGEGTMLPPGYTSYDVDGNGYNWGLSNPSFWSQPMGDIYSGNYLISATYLQSGESIQADNILVLPQITIPAGSTNVTFSYYVGSGTDTSYYAETYDVIVTTENSQAAILAATPVHTETLPSQGGFNRTLNLDSYAGQSVYISFFHRDSFDEWILGLDNLLLTVDGGGEPNEYCIPLPLDCTDGDVIYNVTFAGIDNDSDCSPDGYGDYTALAPAQVVAGETYEIQMEIGAGWYEKVSLWIDFDNNSTFDADERFDVVEGDTGGVMTGSITIPADAAEGTFRMRFFLGAVGSDNPYPQDPCNSEDTGYGEIEDYMITVGDGGSTGEECNQEVLSNALENGLFLGGADNQRLAVDVSVDANTEMTISGIEPTIIVPEGSEATTFGFVFYEDNGGIPGNEIENVSATIVSSTVTGQNFGRDFIRYVLTLDTPVVLNEGTYWMEMTSDAEGWEATTASVLGSTLVFMNASTSGAWIVDGFGTELVYEIVATCETLGVSDVNSYDFAYYPNPVKDELNIVANKSIQSVAVYSLTGQQVSAQKMNASNGVLNMSSLAKGVYIVKAVLEGGQVETFKVVKK